MLSDIYYKGLDKEFNTKSISRNRLPKIFSNYQFIGLLTIKYVYGNSRRLHLIPIFKLINK